MLRQIPFVELIFCQPILEGTQMIGILIIGRIWYIDRKKDYKKKKDHNSFLLRYNSLIGHWIALWFIVGLPGLWLVFLIF
jgi:hypothetical protein